MNLYKVNENLMLILSEMEGIAINPELSDFEKEQQIDIVKLKYIAIEGIKEEKALNLVRAYKNSLSMEKAIAEEIKSLTARKNSHHSKAESIKKFLSYIVTTGEKLEDSTAKIGWRKSESVWFDEMNMLKLPEQTLTTKVTVNKTALKGWVKENGGNKYCRLETNQNIQLK